MDLLESKYSLLLIQVETLAAQLANQTLAMETQQDQQRNYTEAIRVQVRSEMASMKEAFEESLQVAYDDLLTRVENVSEAQKLYSQNRQLANDSSTATTPSGSRDMSRCRYSSVHRSSSAADDFTVTSWMPADEDEFKDWVMTGVECATSGGIQSELERREHPFFANIWQFRCKCFGSTDDSLKRLCQMHIWDCPVR
ncbi:hypothetical protein LSAT2_013657 [Lamellibrachia satsuma]|nr:hypothetical protein LSAT2_013657 [Lamellibrachia satsuma]